MEIRRSVRLIVFLLSLLLFMGAGFTAGILADRFVLSPAIALASGPVQTDELALVSEAYQIIQQVYVDRDAIQPTRLVYGAINGMVDALGDTGHSRFLTPEMVKQQKNLTKGSFEGIGAEVTMENGQVVIVSPIDGSPAQAVGVKPGDIFVAVDGVDVRGFDLNEVVTRVLGPAGTSVTITFRDPENGTLRDVTITRAIINLKNVTWILLPGTSIAHLRISAFSQGVTAELDTALRQITAQGAAGIVLDLRNNPGGLLDESVGVASQFLEGGYVLKVKDAAGQVRSIPVEPGGLALDIPLVVLINQGSASASEIVAGALQDAGRASLVGETTFGTGTVLNHFGLSDGSEILLATQEWLTPKGRTIWHLGIQPDEPVNLSTNVIPLTPKSEAVMTAAQLQASSDLQLLKAIEMLLQE